MADCATCSKPLGGQRRRCSNCGACEECCGCSEDDFVPFSPAELGLDPEDYDLDHWENHPRRRPAARRSS